MTEMMLALNGNAGPVRRPAWRLKEATYVRYVFLGIISFILISRSSDTYLANQCS
jgi:hypothetical protein